MKDGVDSASLLAMLHGRYGVENDEAVLPRRLDRLCLRSSNLDIREAAIEIVEEGRLVYYGHDPRTRDPPVYNF